MAIRNVSAAKNSPECVCGRGSAPDPARGVGWDGMPLPHSHLSDALGVPGRRLHSAPVLIMKSRRLCLSLLIRNSYYKWIKMESL